MNRTEPSVEAFGGVAGLVLKEAMSLRTLLSGIVFVLVVGILGLILKTVDAVDAARAIAALLSVVVLARFALNGYGGEWGGTIFSARGGSWLSVGVVSSRYLLLSAVWFLPVILLGWRPDAAREAVGTALLGGDGGKILSLTVIAAALTALTPPVFLIVSVGAERFLDLIDIAHWRRLFSGRSADLHLVYSIYMGALLFLGCIAVPILLAVAAIQRDIATVIGLPVLAFAAGCSLDLLGRLCGFFAATKEETEIPEATPAGPRLALVEGKGEPRPVIPPAGAFETEKTERGTLNPTGKTPLLDARERVEEQIRRFESDPSGAIAVLTELSEVYAPQPLVLHALTLALAHLGRTEESYQVAKEAMPLCLERGTMKLAAEIYAVHLDRSEAFSLSRDRVLTLAQDLRKNRDLAAAESAYWQILHKDAGERRAVKGLLVLAEDHFENEEYGEARRIYAALLEQSADSPLAGYMEKGIADCDRRLAKAS